MEEIKTYMLLVGGVATTFYRSDVNKDIPAEAIEISTELWQQLLSLGQAKLKNKKKKSNFKFSDFEQNVIEPTEEEKKEIELQELYKWFTWYDEQCLQWARETRAGYTEIDIDELDRQAEINKARINEIRELEGE